MVTLVGIRVKTGLQNVRGSTEHPFLVTVAEEINGGGGAKEVEVEPLEWDGDFSEFCALRVLFFGRVGSRPKEHG
jgi:hypothetical protein